MGASGANADNSSHLGQIHLKTDKVDKKEGTTMKTSKRTIEGMLEQVREIYPEAANWQILRNVDNGYGLYIPDNEGNLRVLLDLGETAPQAASTLNGALFAIRLFV
jgi:hypothetical protein